MPEGGPRVQVNTRMDPELKRQLEEYAKRRGMSVNAAVLGFIIDGLKADKRREGRRD